MPLVNVRTLTVAWFAFAAVGCAEQVESPALGLEAIEPNLVCNAQRVEPDALVELSGSGFTPMPTNVLAEPSILILPDVELALTQDLAGSSSTGTELVFPGTPGEELSNNLVWTSRERMTVRISEADPAVELDPGLYDVTVVNPDGKTRAGIPQGLAVVPPPSISDVAPLPPAVCTDQGDRELVVSGENFLVVAGTKPTITMALGDVSVDLAPDQLTMSGCSAVPGTFAGGTIELCDTVNVTIRQAQLAPGAYTVSVTSPAPASCTSVEAPLVVIVPKPVVSDIVPPAICVDQTDQVVSVHGGNFARINVGEHAGEIPTVTVTSDDGGTINTYVPVIDDASCAPPAGVDATFGVDLCDTLSFTIPSMDLPEGDYRVTIENPQPVGCASEDVVSLRVNAPPTVTSVVPATVCSGGSVLEVTGSGFQPGATARVECAGGTADAAVTVESESTAIVTVGPGVVAGEVCDVVLTNPDGCDDRPLPHQTVTGTEGPILFNVDPHVAYNGINTKVTLYVTALDGGASGTDFTVRMWPDGDTAAAVELDSNLAPGKATVIQATIPSGTEPGSYTLSVNDQSGCLASLEGAVTVTDTTVVDQGAVVPPFGEAGVSIGVTITLGSDPGATGTPRAFLNPDGDDPAIQLQSVTVIDTTTLTAVVPDTVVVGTYDLVIVWPDGNVAVLSDAYSAVEDPPPVIDDVVPQSIVDQSGQSIELRGSGFSGAEVTLRCQTAGNVIIELDAAGEAEDCSGDACTLSATVDGSQVAQGDVCVVRATNSDGSYSEFSAIGVTNSSFNLAEPVAGPPMNTGRRALVSAAIKASNAARFVYAIGGDDGNTANAFDSVEFAPVDIFGNMNPWLNAEQSLGSARAFAGTASIGRYVYVFGGNDGGGALASAERALVLSPAEIPELDDVDLCLLGGSVDCFATADLSDGLAPGLYSYRIAALIDDADPVNLGGETLASDPIILRLREVGDRRVTVKITWSAPRDAQGDELSGISGYRIYRTPADGSPGTDERMLAEVDADTLTFIDDGSETLGSRAPLPQGSTSSWQALPDLAVAREGVAGATAVDPDSPDTWYVYALLGRDDSGAHATYEYLTVTLEANGRQSVGSSWTTGAESSLIGRWQHGAWMVDAVNSSFVSGSDTWIYLGAGLDGSDAEVDLVEAALVQAGGELTGSGGDFPDSTNASDPVRDFSSVRAGYGTAAAAGSLFLFGGSQGGGSQSNARAAKLDGAPDLANNSWNNEGLAMTEARSLLGCSIQSAFIFLVGGTGTGTNALSSTETVVW